MESTNQQAAVGTGEAEPILHVNRSLIPLEEYAEREGVSVSIVYECAKMGIVQIRKCREKSYVVDVPLSPHMATLQTKNGAISTNDSESTPKRLSQKIKEFSNVEDLRLRLTKLDHVATDKTGSKKAQGKHSSALHYTDGFLDEHILEQIESSDAFRREVLEEPPVSRKEMDDDDIIEMLELEPPEQVQTIEEPIPNQPKDATDDEPIRVPDLEVPLQSSRTEQPTDILEVKQIFQSDGITEENELYNTMSIFQTRRFWQVTTSFVLLLFVTAVCVTVWVYSDYRVQQERLDKTNASIQSVYNDFTRQKETNNTLQNQLVETQARLSQLQNELNQSSAQTDSLKKQLTQNQQIEDQLQDLPGQINDSLGN
ncbi:MAG: hypothetical protein ACYSUL_02695 [Planctomycetota bacterium]|jgi:hypothetical protein